MDRGNPNYKGQDKTKLSFPEAPSKITSEPKIAITRWSVTSSRDATMVFRDGVRVIWLFCRNGEKLLHLCITKSTSLIKVLIMFVSWLLTDNMVHSMVMDSSW